VFGEAMIQRLVRTAKPSVTAQAGRDQQGRVRLIVRRREIRLNRASNERFGRFAATKRQKSVEATRQ
jgi:hypothetical protein